MEKTLRLFYSRRRKNASRFPIGNLITHILFVTSYVLKNSEHLLVICFTGQYTCFVVLSFYYEFRHMEKLKTSPCFVRGCVQFKVTPSRFQIDNFYTKLRCCSCRNAILFNLMKGTKKKKRVLCRIV